jgi:hypothetical protein
MLRPAPVLRCPCRTGTHPVRVCSGSQPGSDALCRCSPSGLGRAGTDRRRLAESAVVGLHQGGYPASRLGHSPVIITKRRASVGARRAPGARRLASAGGRPALRVPSVVESPPLSAKVSARAQPSRSGAPPASVGRRCARARSGEKSGGESGALSLALSLSLSIRMHSGLGR